MPRPLKPEREKKVQLNVSVQQWIKDEIRKHKNYSRIVESLILDFINKKGK